MLVSPTFLLEFIPAVMGITGLLPLLKTVMRKTHLSQLSGSTCGVDGYVWLHRAIYSCGSDLVLNPENACSKYLNYCMSKVFQLVRWKIKPFIVFDGKPLPSKSHTNKSRKEKRSSNMSKAMALSAEGKNEEAKSFYNKATPVTFRMVSNFIRLLKANNIDYVIAPYEADAQLAWMSRNGVVDYVITEDGDLILYECPRILFKLDNDGMGSLLELKHLHLCRNFKITSPYMLRQACIIAGCDYFPGLEGFSLIKSNQLVHSHSTISDSIKSISSRGMLKSSVDDVLENIWCAEMTFLYQVIYNTIHGVSQRINLIKNSPSSSNYEDKRLDEERLTYAGQVQNDRNLASMISKGILDPITEMCCCQEDYASLQDVERTVYDERQIGGHSCLPDASFWYRDAILYEKAPISRPTPVSEDVIQDADVKHVSEEDQILEELECVARLEEMIAKGKSLREIDSNTIHLKREVSLIEEDSGPFSIPVSSIRKRFNYLSPTTYRKKRVSYAVDDE